jgi:tetratricopeptide (TPR) repeat protein
MLWQARTYFEIGELNEGMSLLQLLKSDAYFPKRLLPFLNEQIAYGYYLMEVYDKAASSLEDALPNAIDDVAKTRWYYLIAQLWQKAENWKNAYTWYKKAEQNSTNPIIGVYAKIATITIDSKNSNTPWIDLAYSLEKMIKREKFKPYTDIIYFEMAKLAIQNKAYNKATEWLIYSIKKNNSNLKQKQKAFELLANINYNINEFSISRIAYDSLQGVLKTNPNYETIQLRKKWMKDIELNDKISKTQDTLQLIYDLMPDKQLSFSIAWQKRQTENKKFYKNIFEDKYIVSNKENMVEPNINATLLSNYNSSTSSNSDFYFDNKSTVQQGKQNFIRKWGERPNVDQWRRKTSPTIAYGNKQNGNNNQNQVAGQNVTGSINPLDSKPTKENDSLPIQLIKDANGLASSMAEWNKAALANAQLFLQQLNDFEKAYPIYVSIIHKNIDSVSTERAMLDLASQYMHDNMSETADSIIQIVVAKFPNGFYVTKKNETLAKKNKDNNLVESYKEAYFLTQIGNWEQFSTTISVMNSSLRGSKWHTPYQFLKVKMYAQQRKDSLAIKLLDTIISSNRNERIKDKAKIILEEISKRAVTEKYLDTLKINKVIKELPFVLIKEEPNLLNSITKRVGKDSSILNSKVLVTSGQKDNQVDSNLSNLIEFVNDSLEPHYIALITNKVSASFVKEIQNAFNILNNDEFSKQNLNVTYVQFDNLSYIVWIGSFSNRQNASLYLNKVKSRLSKEIISFVPTKQYQLYLLGKSNIILIKTPEDLKKYEQFMINTFYKP